MSYHFRPLLLLPFTSMPSICGFSASWGHPIPSYLVVMMGGCNGLGEVVADTAVS